MKYLIVFFVLFFILTGSSVAQHCQWDGSAFIMLSIKQEKPVTIQNIYLLDYSGAIFMNKTYYTDSVSLDSAIFWKNPAQDKAYNSREKRAQRFSFAKDYYVLPFGFRNDQPPYKILVEYNTGKKIQTKEFEVPKDKIYHLCTTHKELWSGDKEPLLLVIK